MHSLGAAASLVWSLVLAFAGPVESPEGKSGPRGSSNAGPAPASEEAIGAPSVPPPRVDAATMDFTPEAMWVGPYRLVEQAGGRWTHFSAKHGVVAHVAADGSVRFEYPGGVGADPEAARLQLEANALRGMDDSSTYDPRQRAAYANDPSNGAMASAAVGVAIAGISAATRGARGAGKSLTVARPEADFLAHTADFRSDLARAYYAETYALALGRLAERFQQAWRVRGPDVDNVSARHRAVFELWSGFEDGLPMPPPGIPPGARDAIDRLRADFGRQGREKVEGLIRVVAPEGSARSFSAAGLGVLNKGARVRFAPYGAMAEHPPVPPKAKRKRRRRRER